MPSSANRFYALCPVDQRNVVPDSSCRALPFPGSTSWGVKRNRAGRPWRTLAALILLALFVPACRADEPQAGAPVDVNLKQLSLEELGNVEVTTASKEPEQVWHTPAAIYVLTQEDIRRSGATSIPEALQLVPGVEVAQEDSDHWSISIRGFGAVLASKILVLIDGRSIYTPLFAGVYWEAQATPLEDIERIEVIRGPGGTIWGANAVDGIINIITKSATQTHGALASAGGGSADHTATTIRYGTGNGKGFDFRVYGMGFARSPEFHANADKFDSWQLGQGGFRADWDRNVRDSFTIQGDGYNESAGEATSYALYSPPSQVAAQGNASLWGANILGRWKHVFNQGSDFQLQAYYDHTHHFEPEFGENRDTFDVDFLYHLTLPKQQDFLWGVGARVSPATIVQLVPTINFLPNHQTDQIYSGFVQDEIPFAGNRFSLTLGSKFEHNNYTGFEYQPNGRLLWNLTPRQALWGAISRAVRTPSRIDEDVQLTDFAAVTTLPIYLLVDGNSHFVSERLIAYEAGYRALVIQKWYVDLAVFHNDYNDIYSFQVGAPFLEATPTPVHAILPLLTSNGIRGATNGFEVAPDWKPWEWWELKGSYSYLNMSLENRSWSNDPTSVANYEGSSPHHEITVQSLLNLPKRLQLDETLRYVSGLPAESVGGYVTANARLGWHVTQNLELSVAGQNLLQPHHAEFGGDPGGLVGIKRSIFAKITWVEESR